jgi:hypothetical protein
MSRKPLLPNFFGSLDEDPLLESSSDAASKDDASKKETPSKKNKDDAPKETAPKETAPKKRAAMRGAASERGAASSSREASSRTSSSPGGARQAAASEGGGGTSSRRGYRVSPLFKPTDARERPRARSASPEAAPAASSAREEGETEAGQRAFVVKQIRGQQSNVEELNRAIESGWRLVHIAPISRRPSPDLVETDFAALVTLRRPAS